MDVIRAANGAVELSWPLPEKPNGSISGFIVHTYATAATTGSFDSLVIIIARRNEECPDETRAQQLSYRIITSQALLLAESSITVFSLTDALGIFLIEVP